MRHLGAMDKQAAMDDGGTLQRCSGSTPVASRAPFFSVFLQPPDLASRPSSMAAINSAGVALQIARSGHLWSNAFRHRAPSFSIFPQPPDLASRPSSMASLAQIW
ncbi:hypothetical protein BT93_J0146 [Corymbia citriodora subsp. variegata]|nr:hypothetical protein BT93_J0146 [Corymbia citriodora subsp. variegata]